MRTPARTNRLLDELREELKELSTRLKRVEAALDVAFPGRFLLTPPRRGGDAGNQKLY